MKKPSNKPSTWRTKPKTGLSPTRKPKYGNSIPSQRYKLIDMASTHTGFNEMLFLSWFSIKSKLFSFFFLNKQRGQDALIEKKETPTRQPKAYREYKIGAWRKIRARERKTETHQPLSTTQPKQKMNKVRGPSTIQVLVVSMKGKRRTKMIA